MAREQSGICAEANLHCCYLLLNALDGHEHYLRLQLAKVPYWQSVYPSSFQRRCSML